MKEELEYIRALGITPIPKCNFSCGHSAWLKEYAYMVGTQKYNQVCKDIIEELIELFDTPPYFQLGLEEEDTNSQQGQPIAIVRSASKKPEDANYLFDICRAKGVRPWIWADENNVKAFGGDEAFCKNVGRDVIISNFHYGVIRCDEKVMEKYSFANYCDKFSKWGYDQVPTGSTWTWHVNNKDIMRFCKTHLDDKSIYGYMTASWLFTVEKKYYALLADAENFAYARRDIYGDF